MAYIFKSIAPTQSLDWPVSKTLLSFRLVQSSVLFHEFNAILIYLIYCFAGAISSHQRGTQYTSLTKSFIVRRIEGHSRSVIRSCGCNQEGRRLSWETRIDEVGFEVFPDRCDRGAIFIWEGKEFQRTGVQWLKELEKCLIDLWTLRPKWEYEET